MNRREFSLQMALAGGLGSLVAPVARAQGAPVEGTHYTKVSPPAPVSAPAGKVEVVEFFSYGCPHCYSFEPAVEGWSKQLPDYIVFRRVPVAFNALYETYQKIYFALEAMGQVDAMQRKVFEAIHVQRQRLDKEADIVAFMKANGLDAAKFAEHYKSFSVLSSPASA
jgi:thiol:disulfide interchange protein DsbA